MNFINSLTDTIGLRSPHNGAASEAPRSCAPMEAGCGDEQAAIVALRRRSPARFTPWSLHELHSGSVLALRQSLTKRNVLGGFTSAYFVTTALTTVRPASEWTRWVDRCAVIVAFGLAITEIGLGLKAFARRDTSGACASRCSSRPASFFSIRARVARILPEPFTAATMRALPVALVFVAMFYWCGACAAATLSQWKYST